MKIYITEVPFSTLHLCHFIIKGVKLHKIYVMIYSKNVKLQTSHNNEIH